MNSRPSSALTRVLDSSTFSRIDKVARLILASALLCGVLAVLAAPHRGPVALPKSSMLTSYSNSYNVTETYGGTNPSEHCTYCEVWGKPDTGTATPPSTDPDTIVNTATGDMSDSYTLFSEPEPGPNMSFTLYYDSLYSQLEAFYAGLLGTPEYGSYGYGWRAAAGSGGVVNTAGSYAQVVSPSGSEIDFQQVATQGACQTGDTDRTIWGSQYFYCGAGRLDATFASESNYGAFVLAESGGRQTTSYNGFGQMTGQGDAQVVSETYQYNVTPGGSGCPASTPHDCTVVQDRWGHSYQIEMQQVTASGSTFDVATAVVDPAGHVWPLSVTGNGLLGAVADPLGDTWQFNYDQTAGAPDYNDLTVLTDPDNNQTHIAYSPAGTNGGLVTSVTDGTTYNTTYFNQASGWCTSCQSSGFAYSTVVTHPDHQIVTDVYQAYEEQQQTVSSNLPGTTYSATTMYSYSNTSTGSTETITDPMGYVTTDTTDLVGNVLSEQNNYGTTTTTYNGWDEPCWSAPPGVPFPTPASCTTPPPKGPYSATSGPTLYAYDGYGNQTQVTDATGTLTQTMYDINGEPCWTSIAGTALVGSPSCGSLPAAATWYTYVGGLMTAQQTPDGYGTTYIHNKTTYTYNSYGEVLTQVSPNGYASGGSVAANTTTNYYDNAGRLWKVTSPGSGTTPNRIASVTLDAAGNELFETDPMGIVTTKTYDPDNRLCWSFVGTITGATCTLPPSSHATIYSYNADTADPATTYDPDGHEATYQYFNPVVPDKATVVTDGVGNVTSNVYDNDGNVCVTGAESTSLYGGGYQTTCGFRTGYTYDTFDQLGNVMSTTNPSNKTTSYGRSDADFPAAVTSVTPPTDVNGVSNVTDYAYDADGRVHTKQVMATGGLQQTILYNPTGTECAVTPQVPSTATCTTATLAGSSQWTYYFSNLPAIMTDYGTGSPSYTTWSYDAQGQELAQTSPSGTVNYGYDPASDNTCVGYPASASLAQGACGGAPSGTVAQYTFDSDGRMASMSDWLGHTTNFGWDANSNVTSIQYPSVSNWYDKYSYDAASNLTSQYFTVGSYTSPTQTFAPDGDNHYVTDEGVAEGYNAKNQVTSTGSGSSLKSLTYNPDGEVTADGSASIQSTNYEPDSELQAMTTTAGFSTQYSYDVNGNRCASGFPWPSSCSTLTTDNYGWNVDNQLCYVAIGATVGGSCSTAPTGGSVTSYGYDGNNLRVSETTGGTTSRFAYNTQTRPGQPLIIDDGTNLYLYGPGDFGAGTAPLEQYNLSTATIGYLGNLPTGVEVVANSSGTTQSAYAYTPFGTKTVAGVAGETPFGFQGGYTDPTGLIYFVNRYYDPSTDQFLSVDPMVGVTGEPYAFTGDDPLNATDPLGLLSLSHVVNPCDWGNACHHLAHGTARVAKRAAANWCANFPTSPGCHGTAPTSNLCKGGCAGTLKPGSSSGEARAELERSGVSVPSDYSASPADNGKGWVFRPPGSNNNDDAFRAMEQGANPDYPNGYYRTYNSSGQPLTPGGFPGSNSQTHSPFDDELGD
jgi:RHS repeat-associated protein